MRERSPLFKFLCTSCQRRSPMFVSGAFRWRCAHAAYSITEGLDYRYLVFDQEHDGADEGPVVCP